MIVIFDRLLLQMLLSECKIYISGYIFCALEEFQYTQYKTQNAIYVNEQIILTLPKQKQNFEQIYDFDYEYNFL